ncbi:MAG: translocation/assembly module TamB domain-containing protein [Acidobacteriota bacterium]
MEERVGEAGNATGRWVKVTLVVAGCAVVLAALLAISALLSLRVAGVRRTLIASADRAAREDLGVSVGANDFDLDLRRGMLAISRLSVAVPGSAPFLTVERLHVEADVSTLRGPVVVFRVIEVDRPRIDLGAALPPLPEGRRAGPPGRDFEVRSLRICGGEIVNGTVPPSAARWISTWSLAGVRVDGSYLGGMFDADIAAEEVAVVRTGGERHEAKLELSGKGRPGAAFALDALRLEASGLLLTATADGVAGPRGPLRASVQATIEPALALPELGTGGSVRLGVSAELPEGRVVGHADARGIAAEALRPWLGERSFALASAAGTTIDVVADLSGPVADPNLLNGSARIAWNAGGERLLDASASLRRVPDGARPVRVDLAAALLPDLEGVRRAEATVSARSLVALADGVLESGALALDHADLSAAYADLRERWPLLVPERPEAVPLVGSMRVDAKATGPLSAPLVSASAVWTPESGTSVTASASGEPLRRRGEATVVAERLRLGILRPDLEGVVSATARAAGSPESYRATLTLDGEALRVSPGAPALDTLHVEAATDGTRVEATHIAGALGESRFAGSAEVAIALPIADARLALHVTRPLPQIAAADVTARLAGGVLVLDVPGVDTSAGSAALSATVPLGALRAVPALAPALADIPVVAADGPVGLTVEAPGLDTCTLAPLLGLSDREERVRADVRAELLVDLADPTSAVGELTLSGLRADLGGRSVAADAPVRLRFSDRRARLLPVEFATDGVDVGLEGEATLAGRFLVGEDGPASIVTHLAAEIAGTIDAGMLQSYLAGGVAQGELRFDASAAGPPAEVSGSFSLYGPEASFFWPAPYATRVSGVELAGEIRGGEVQLRRGRAALNGGFLGVTGRRSGDGSLSARVTIGDVRYRLDYGVSAVLDGDLRLAVPAAGRGELDGEVVLRRALLTRDIDIDREVVRRFLSPVTTAGTESGALDTVDLDVVLSTVDGVKVRNNVADLALSWEPLEIGGTAWNPTILGRVDVRPGGLVFAYGQTVRIDSGSFTFTGNPITDPLIELRTTSSLTDPSVARLGAGNFVLGAPPAEGDAVGAGEALAAGVAGYFGERLGSELAESLGLGRVSLRPVLIFGEADPGARLTLTRDLSANVAFAFSLDLRNAQRQTYLLDLHGLHLAPSLSAQVFTTDGGEAGTTLQQTFEFGGPRRAAGSGPVVAKVRATPPEGVRARALRAAIGVGRGDPLPDGAAFDIEVEVATLVRDSGYPDAEVRVQTVPSNDRAGRVDLVVAIEPGPRARFRFEGEKIPAGSRALVTSLYRTGFWEAPSIEEMRKAAVRVLRARGFLDPRVEIAVGAADAAAREVTIRTEGGRRFRFAPPRFVGLDAADEALVASRFPTLLERAELAAGMGDADARVLESLRVLGYPGGRIVGRALDGTTGVLTVTLAPGPRTVVAAVGVEGLSVADVARLRPLLPLAAGDSARTDRIALAALAVERDLRSRGFAGATVRPRVAAAPTAEPAVEVALVVEPGEAYRLGSVSFDALRSTRRSLVERLAGLEEGGVYRAEGVAAARARLARLGVFSSVAVESALEPGGIADVTFRTVEQTRFTLGYGVRWETEEGVSAVVDAVDRNLLGRAVTLGMRARYENDDRSGRLYLGVPDLLGTRVGIQAFAERRRRVTGYLQNDTLDSTLGVTHPAGRDASVRAYAAYRDSRLTETEPDPFFPLDIRVRHPYLGAQLVVDTRSDPLRGSEGVFASVDLSGSGSFAGSDFEYVRLFGQFNLYRPLRVGPLEATWAQSVRVGLARPFSGQELIPDVRFFAGGEYSVRGYGNESLGPTETLGDVSRAVGGEALFVLNEELRVPLPWDLVGLVFVDVGNVWASPSDFGRELATALGLGLRADTPVGLLRLDAAFPFDARDGEPGFKLYFGFGNAF